MILQILSLIQLELKVISLCYQYLARTLQSDEAVTDWPISNSNLVFPKLITDSSITGSWTFKTFNRLKINCYAKSGKQPEKTSCAPFISIISGTTRVESLTFRMPAG